MLGGKGLALLLLLDAPNARIGCDVFEEEGCGQEDI